MDISLRRLVGFLRGGPDRRPGVPSRSLPASDSAREALMSAQARALTCLRQGQRAQAEEMIRAAVESAENVLGPDHIALAEPLVLLAQSVKEDGRLQEGEPLLRRALEIRERALGPDAPAVGASLNNLALLYQELGDHDRAVPLYHRCLAIVRRGPERLPTLCRRVIALVENGRGPRDLGLAMHLNRYAALLRATGRDDEAVSIEDRVKAIGRPHS